MGNQHRLTHSPNRRGGFEQAVGAMWEVEAGHSLRNLDVIANADGVRIRDMYCGEVEMAEQQAVWLDLGELKQLAEVLADALRVFERDARIWKSNADRVNPRAMLDRAQADRMAADAEREADIAHLKAMLAGPPDVDLVANVVIHNAGDRKLGVIKVLRQFAWDLHEHQLGLASAKAIVDGEMPKTVVVGIDVDAANQFADALRQAGAEASVDTWAVSSP